MSESTLSDSKGNHRLFTIENLPYLIAIFENRIDFRTNKAKKFHQRVGIWNKLRVLQTDQIHESANR